MPKIVDHEHKKKQIAEATWRVILAQGMEGVSVRNIAREAGISLGALRYYFSTQEELLMYAMELVRERAAARIINIIQSDLPPKEKILNSLLELIPVNENNRVEMDVWFAFMFHFRNKKELFDPKFDGIFEGIQKLLQMADRNRMLKPGLNLILEAEKLYALVDGLAMHALFDPQRVDEEKTRLLLTNYLNSLWDSTD